MAFIGNTNTTQAFTPAIDYFSGTGSATAFTLSRPVASVAQVQVTIDNVAQNPSSAYTISGSTITFTSAPLSGTNNIYVYYTSPITQIAALPQNPQVFGNLQFSSLGARITGDFSNATIANRAIFQSTTANGASGVIAIPNGTGVVASWSAQNNSDANNGANIALRASDTDMSVRSGILGTGTYLPMTFYTGGSERVRVDTSGNVGIGTLSPSVKADIAGVMRSATWSLSGTGVTGGTSAFAAGTVSTDTNWGMYFRAPTGSSAVAEYTFRNSADTERIRIDTSGNLLVGTAATINTNGVLVGKGGAAGGGIVNLYKTASGGTNGILNYYQSTYVGGINFDNTSTSFPTSSDKRLKKDISDSASATQKIDSIRIVSHGWKHDESVVDFGIIAQDLYEIMPRAVSKGDDEDEIKTIWSVDYSKLVPLLIKAHQEQQALITSLTARITALESR